MPVKPWTIVLHCIHMNGFKVLDQRSRPPKSDSSPPSSAAE